MQRKQLAKRGTLMGRFFVSDGLGELLDWLRHAPPGTSVLADVLVARLGPLLAAGPALHRETVSSVPGAPGGWQERLWTAPAETRLSVRDAAEAIGRPRSWVYRRTGVKCPNARLPHRQLDGALVFLAGELRQWLMDHELVLVAPVVNLTRPRARRVPASERTP